MKCNKTGFSIEIFLKNSLYAKLVVETKSTYKKRISDKID